MTLFKSAPQCPSLPSPPGERLILLKALCSLFVTLIPKIPSVMSLNTNTHGPFNGSDSEKNKKGRKLGQNSLIIAGWAMGFGDRFKTGTSNEIIMAERIQQQISSRGMRTGSAQHGILHVSSGCPVPWVGPTDGETGAVLEIPANRQEELLSEA